MSVQREVEQPEPEAVQPRTVSVKPIYVDPPALSDLAQELVALVKLHGGEPFKTAVVEALRSLGLVRRRR